MYKGLMITVVAALMVGCSGGGSETPEPIEYTAPKVTTSLTFTPHLKIMVGGQSNAANSGLGYKKVSTHDVNRIDTNGESVHAVSPVGSTGRAGSAGSFMTALGDRLIEGELCDKVTYINTAVAGSKIESWTPQGANWDRIVKSALLLNVDVIIWHQGESDAQTSVNNYKSRFLRMLQGMRELGITAPIYIARTSHLNGKTDASVIQAQSELIAEYDDIYEGPYTDVLGDDMRYDRSHFNPIGIEAHAELWAEALL